MRIHSIEIAWAWLTVTTAVSIFGLMGASAAQAGWFDDFRLTDDAAGSYISTNNAKCVASDTAGNIHVVWTDYRDALASVYYKMFDGASWSDDQRITDSTAVSAYPAIAADGLGNVHVVWVDYRDGNSEIYYKKSDGAVWGSSVRLTYDTASSLYPSVAGDMAGQVYVVWQDLRDSDWEVYYKESDGVNWSGDIRLTTNTGLSEYPCVVVDASQTVHVTWQDYRDADYEIYYKRNDGSWSADQRLTSVYGASQRPCVASDGLGRLHLVWQDYRSGSYGIYYSLHDGAAWQTEELLTSVSMGQLGPSVAADDSGRVHVVWYAYPEVLSDLYYRFHDGISWGPELRLTYADHTSENPSVGSDGRGNIDVVWHDRRDGNCEIYWKRLPLELLLKPELTSIEPDSALWNSVVSAADIAGDHFLAPATVWLQRTGEANINAANVAVVSPERITCDINLGTAPSGLWDVVVQNPDSQMDTLVSGFRIIPLPSPEITSIEPDSAHWYSTVHITDLAGDNFTAGTLAWLQKLGQPRMWAYNVAVVSPTRITCDIDCETLEDGYWDVVVQIPDGQSDTLAAGFKVLPLPGPEITAIEPASWPRDNKVHITNLAGDYFSTDIRVWLRKAGELDIAAENIVIESPSKITCDTELAAAALGWWDVIVENFDTQRDTLDSGFFVDQSMWDDETRLTSSSGASYTPRPNARCIVTDASDNVHVVWHDTRSGSNDIYYKLYDGSWHADQPIVDVSQQSKYPALAIGNDDVLHVVWQDSRTGVEIYYKSYDGGWSSDERLTDATGSSSFPSVAADGDKLHVVWQDDRTGTLEILYKHFDGTSWGTDQQISSGTGGKFLPAVAAAGGNVHVIWCDYSHDDLCYRKFDGISWGSTVILDDGNFEGAASIAVDVYGNVHIAWQAHDSEIYYRFSDGSTWDAKQRLTYDGAMSHNTSVVADAAGNVYIPFVDDREGNNELYCIKYNGSSWESEVRLTNAPYNTRNPSAVIDSQGRLHVVWRDQRFGNFEIFYRMRYPGDLAAVDPYETALPARVTLRFAPNPVRTGGSVRFSLPKAAEVALAVYDIGGRLVWSDEIPGLGPGIHQVAWNGTDHTGRPVAQGIYLLGLRAGEQRASAKIVVIR